MATSSTTCVTELGFVEKVDSWRLFSHYFPSKVGGKPAWLSLKNLPAIDDLTCKLCQRICIFLLQIYANVDDKDDCFHRSIFIFICKNPKCLQTDYSKSLFAFRSQLPRSNTFYPREPPSEVKLAENYPKAGDFQQVCDVCGCAGSKACSKCHSVTYCSKDHQAADWKAGHKVQCGKSGDKEVQRKACSVLFPEFEVVTEPEEYEEDSDEEKSEEQKQAEYRQFVKKAKDTKGTLNEVSNKELESMSSSVTDEVFEQFQKRIKNDPEQVVRYNRGGTPLWVASTPEHPVIPKCQCGADRQFEFQIMPQLLNHLNVDSTEESLDWGSLIVYTCKDSCTTGELYLQEYVLKQDFANLDCVPESQT